MNLSSLIGLVLSLGLVGGIVVFGTENPGNFVDPLGLLIVIGGTAAATLMSYPMRELIAVFRLVGAAWRREQTRLKEDVDELVRVTRLWVRGDIRGVEKALEQTPNPFLRAGVQMVIDRVPEGDIQDVLQWRIARMQAREAAHAQMFRVMAAYAPAFGMVGTLIGLANLMTLLGDGDVAEIGRQLGVALMTTFYGVLLANLVFKPIAVKLERRTEQRLGVMNLVLEGVSMMCAQRSPGMMKATLQSFVEEAEDEIDDGRPAAMVP